MGYQYRDEEVARIVSACKGALGDDARARFTRGVLEIGRGWRVARALWWLAAAVVIAAVLALVGTMRVIFAEDRFLSALELAGWLAPAVLIAALGVVLARPRVARIDGTGRTIRINGKRHPLADRTLVLARIVASSSGFDLELSVRGGPSIIALEWVEASAAARMKALAIAIASWLGAPLVETSVPDALESLRDADAQLGLAVARPPGAGEPTSPHSGAPDTLDTVIDVAELALHLLDGL